MRLSLITIAAYLTYTCCVGTARFKARKSLPKPTPHRKLNTGTTFSRVGKLTTGERMVRHLPWVSAQVQRGANP
jgi:hypothetical protein